MQMRYISFVCCGFRWDALEDFVIYGLIMLGLIVRYSAIYKYIS